MSGLPRRILVALDASEASREAAAAAAELAGLLGAELEGLFVEDLNLLRLARLPFARQVGLTEGAELPLDQRSLEAELRAIASWARELLEEAARRHKVAWSFRVVRGEVTGEVLAAAGQADLLVLGPTGRRARLAPGGTARQAAARARAPVLFASSRPRADRPVALVYDGGGEADRALIQAVQLAEKTHRELALLVPAAGESAAVRLADQAGRRLGLPGPLQWRWTGGVGAAELLGAIQAAAPGLLVVLADSPIVEEDGLARLLEAARCPVLLAR